jgi:YD repeat-containing protein
VPLVCALCVGAAAQAQTDRGEAGLRGAVKSVVTEVVESAPQEGGGGGPAGKRVPAQSVTYDAGGHKVKQVEHNHDGSVSRTLVYTYDADGRATGYEEYTGTLADPRRHVYALDAEGRRVEYRIVQPNGAAGERYLYKYDAKGNLSEEALHEHKGALISRNTYAYDGAGRQVSQTRYDPDGSVSSTISTSYDAHGRPVERVRHEGDILTYRIRYAYDAKGRVVAQETVGSVVEGDVAPSEAHAPGRVVYVYKGEEWPRAALAYAPDGSLRERVEIEYDSRGNWTKRTRLIQPGGARPSRRVEYRAITYFRS